MVAAAAGAAAAAAVAVAGLVAGAVLGVAVQELYGVIKESKKRCSNFRKALYSLENTVNMLSPIINEMARLNQGLNDYQREEIIRLLLQQLKKAIDLVSKCSNISGWNLYKKRKYEKRLMELDFSLRKLSQVLQVGQALDIQRLIRQQIYN